MEKILYVDLDGVLVNFIDGWMDHYFIMNRRLVTKWNFGEDYGLDREDFYKSITSLPISFWSNLTPLPWAREFLGFLKMDLSYSTKEFDVDKIMFLSHSVSEDCRIGKQLWVNKHFPDLGDSLITVSDSKLKSKFANQNSVLIDDKFETCVDFVKAGGKSWLFARPWNRGVACKKSEVIFFPFSTLDQSDKQYTDVCHGNPREKERIARVWHYNSHKYEAVLEPIVIRKDNELVNAMLNGGHDE